VKDENYKLIEYRNGDKEEDKWTFLYDIKNDPWETNNLAKCDFFCYNTEDYIYNVKFGLVLSSNISRIYVVGKLVCKLFLLLLGRKPKTIMTIGGKI
jgi:hypothetical protein